jgi:riboflavin synthase
MFTGLVECTGTVVSFEASGNGRQLRIRAAAYVDHLDLGESIAVNGCCLTAAEFAGEEIIFDILNETLNQTNLGAMEPGRRVNLERALAANARLGGHFVQGHVDGTSSLFRIEHMGTDLGLTFSMPTNGQQYFISKGSIAINGVSLTVSDFGEGMFRVWIIPHTKTHTNLGDLSEGDAVNLEYDVLAKYVERMLEHRG